MTNKSSKFCQIKSKRAAKTFVKFSHFVLHFSKFFQVFQVLERMVIIFVILFAAILITKVIICKAFHISNLNINISRCLYTFQQQHSCFQFYQTSGTSQGTSGVHLHQIPRSSGTIFNDVQRNDGQRHKQFRNRFPVINDTLQDNNLTFFNRPFLQL